MTFQFLCPQGHLLQGDEAHMGMQCQCPQCGTAFIIPTVDRPAPAGGAAPQTRMPPPNTSAPPAMSPVDPPDFKAPPPADAKGNLDFSELAVGELGAAAATESVLHIPCPNGHELETPLDMIGQHVLCPHCNVQFRLKREKSIEYLQAQEIIDRKRARFWYQLSIVALTFVSVVLLAIFAAMLMS